MYDGEDAILALRDSDGAGAAQGYRISNRYLHGNMVDQVLADEQYASGTGPVFSATTASTLAGTTLWTLGDHLGSIRDVIDNTGVTRQHVIYDSFGNRSPLPVCQAHSNVTSPRSPSHSHGLARHSRT